MALLQSENVWLCIEKNTTDTFISLLHHVKLCYDLF